MSKYLRLLFSCLGVLVCVFHLSSVALADVHHRVHLQEVSPFKEKANHKAKHCLLNKHYLDKVCPHGVKTSNGNIFSIYSECGSSSSKNNLSSSGVAKIFF